MFVLALSLYNTWNRGVFLLCKITNLLIYSTLLIIATAYCYHDWVQVAFLFSLSVILYLILFAGVFVDTVLDMTRERIIDFIIS